MYKTKYTGLILFALELFIELLLQKFLKIALFGNKNQNPLSSLFVVVY